MTGRERLQKTIMGQKADRVPIAPFMYYNNVFEKFDYVPDMDNFFNPGDFDPIEKTIEYCDYFGFDVMHNLGSVWDFYVADSSIDKSIVRSWDNWDVTIKDRRIGDERFRLILINTPDGELRCVEKTVRTSKYLIVSAMDEHLVKTSKDFEILRKFAPPADFMDCSLIKRASKAIGNKGIVECCMDGAYNTPGRHFMGYQNFMMLPYEDELLYREMMEYFLANLILRIKKMVTAGADAIEFAANLAGSSVGPGYFEKYVMEYENRLIDAIKREGAYVIYHNCGDAKEIMHLYNRMNIDCWGYVTPPPFGDVDLEDVLKVIRPDMALRGNIDQVEFLKKSSPKEIEYKVKDLLEKVKSRGNWILSTTDFIFDGTPYENIKAFVEAGLEYGKY